jgi:hypothetical protein
MADFGFYMQNIAGKTKIMKKAAIILLVIFSTTLEMLGQKINTDRPDQTEAPVVIPMKSFQIESGLLSGKTCYNSSSENQLLIPTLLFRYGSGKIIELRLVEQMERLKSESPAYNNLGFSDLALGAKIQILRKENVNTQIAFLSHFILPTGSDGISDGNIATDNTIAVSHHLNSFLDISYNIGYDYSGHGNGDMIYSVSLGGGVSEKAGIYAETYGELDELKEPFTNFDTGGTYLLKDNLQLDLSFGIGLNYEMHYFSVGCSWNIPGKQKIARE